MICRSDEFRTFNRSTDHQISSTSRFTGARLIHVTRGRETPPPPRLPSSQETHPPPPAGPTIQRQESARRSRREYVAEAQHERAQDSHPEDSDQPCEAAAVSRPVQPVAHPQRQVLRERGWHGLHARKTPH